MCGVLCLSAGVQSKISFRVSNRAAIALGSNLGDRAAHIRSGVRAIDGLPGTRIIAISSVREFEALVPEGAPAGPAFLNAVVLAETGCGPDELLSALLGIERIEGRDRSAPAQSRWAARTLDLDLLFFDQQVINKPGLVVPHPRLSERLFVLEPLAQIAPDWVHPELRLTVAHLHNRLTAREGARHSR